MSISIPPTWKVDRRGNVAVLALTGDWLAAKSGMLGVAETDQIIGQIGSCTSLQFDTALLARWDSALVAFVWRLHDITGGRTNLSLDLSSLPEPLRRLVCLAAADKGTPGKPPRAPGLLKFAHAYALGCCAGLVASADLLGTFALSIVPALRGRLQARTTDLTALMQECGSQALGIITVVNGLVGAILAFVGAVQLQRFGAGIYVADLVGVATVREMAPIMTAIVMAGRTGGAYAAEIATMEGNEEIDALRILGVSPQQYLVVPRVAALMAMMPIAYFYANLVGVLGGLLVSGAVLDLTPTLFLGQLRQAVPPADFYIGLSKSIVFGAFIAIASCRRGLGAGRSAADVGRAATDAVVTGIIGVIALDAVFAACTNALGI